MIKIYHNNRCSKSRSALQFLEESGKSFEVVQYLQNPPSETELVDLLNLLEIKPFDLVRKGETLYKENFKNQELSDKAWIKILHENPILIERPIVFDTKKAVVARPPELVQAFLEK